MEKQSTIQLQYEPLIEITLKEDESIKMHDEIQSPKSSEVSLSDIVSAQEVALARKQTNANKDSKSKKNGEEDKNKPHGTDAQEQELWNIARGMTSEQKKVTMLRLIEQSRQERHILGLGIFLTFIGAGVYLGTPVMLGAIIDSISQGSDKVNVSKLDPPVQALCNMSAFGCDTSTELLQTAVLTLLVISMIGAACSFGKWFCMEVAGERVVARLRKQLFCAILSQEIAMFDSTKTGELVNRISTDTSVLKTACTTQIAQSLQSFVQVILSIFYVFYLSWSLTLVMLSVVPVVVIVAKWYGMYYRKLSRINQDTLAHATDVATESITLIRTVKSFSKEDEQEKLFFMAIDETYKQGVKMALATAGFMSFFVVLSNLGIGGVMWYGATRVIKGEMNSGSLATYVILTIQIGFSFAVFLNLYSNMMRALGASERMFQLLDRQSSIPPEKSHMARQMEARKNNHPESVYSEEYMKGIIADCETEMKLVEEIKGHVDFENVTFRYPSRPERTILQGLTWKVEPGTICALVGPSGGGKSTVMNLCMRFYDPDSGVVHIDGRDIREYDLRSLHAQMGSVSQEPVLFARTVYENITYGLRRSVSMQEVIAAAKTANAHDFIMSFPDRYDTLVGERGIRLSGGQKQRVAIARAILINPKILLLDEATSALDSESEYLVQQALDRVMVGRTVIVIAHRLSTVRQANQVLVIDNGELVEKGTHETLIKANGAYAKLVSRQLLG